MNDKFNNFDPQAWVNGGSKPEVNNVAPMQTSETDIHAVAQELMRQGKDITAGYEAWRNLGFALAHELGEGGRELYHGLSSMNAEYNRSECDRQYTACLRSHGSGITIASFFKMAQDAGVDIKNCANCANCATAPNTQKDIKVTILIVLMIIGTVALWRSWRSVQLSAINWSDATCLLFFGLCMMVRTMLWDETRCCLAL